MSLHIVFECGTPLPVRRYGGTERIIYWLMKELVRRGVRVSLLGSPRSRVDSIGVGLIPVVDGEDWRKKIPKDASILHLFSSPSDQDLPCPFLVTIEGNGQPGERFHRNTVFISKKHALNHGAVDFVYNGLDLEEYPFQKKPPAREWNHFLFLAKAKWKVKNLESCMRVCRKTKKHLHVAGGRVWTFSRLIHGYGMVDQAKKIDLLKQVNALLFPVRWEEPFGIAMIEAMAMGVPVIGSPYGSLPEVIGSSGKEAGGWVLSSESELEAFVGRPKAPEIHPEGVRARVEKYFSVQKMAENYLDRYQRVMSGVVLQKTTPMAPGVWDPQGLLPW